MIVVHVHVAEEGRDRHLYVLGGRAEEDIHGVERYYDLATGRWEALPSMTESMRLAAAAVVRGRTCMVGGEDSDTLQRTCTMWDPTEETWRALPAMNKGRHLRASTHLVAMSYCVLSDRM